jgi:modification methylase
MQFPVDQILVGHAAHVLAGLRASCIDLVVTSPPYLTAVNYDGNPVPPWPSYAAYLDDLLTVWKECARVLRPNGKLCINAMAMPIPLDVVKQYPRRIQGNRAKEFVTTD